MDYVTFSALQRISYKSLTVYLSGINFHAQLRSSSFDFSSMPRLYYLLRGIRRSQGNSLIKERRQPITVQHMLVLNRHLAICYPNNDGVMLWSACTMAFFGMLRSAEYTAPYVSSFSATTLLFGDVTLNINNNNLLRKNKACCIH